MCERSLRYASAPSGVKTKSPLPHDQYGWLILAKIGMPLVVTLDVAAVIGMQCKLDFFVARPVHSPLRMLPRIRAHQRWIWSALEVLSLRGGQLEEFPQSCFRLRRSLRPDAKHDITHAAGNALVIGVCILNDQSASARWSKV